MILIIFVITFINHDSIWYDMSKEFKQKSKTWIIEAIGVGCGLAIVNFLILSGGVSTESFFIIWLFTFAASIFLVYRLFYHVDTLILKRIHRLTKETQLQNTSGNTISLLRELNQREPVNSMQPNTKRGELKKVENGVYKCEVCRKSYHSYKSAKSHEEKHDHSVYLAWQKG